MRRWPTIKPTLVQHHMLATYILGLLLLALRHWANAVWMTVILVMIHTLLALMLLAFTMRRMLRSAHLALSNTLHCSVRF